MAAPIFSVRLFLYRLSEAAWQQVLQPWLEATHGRLVRSYIVVPTRGQAYALKQRCLVAGLPLLGVEFLTPGLARKKWLPLHQSENPESAKPAIGRELLLLGLRVQLQERLAPLSPESAEWGFWKSVQSDPERILDDFDQLLKAGFREKDFSLPLLQSLFADLRAWADHLGYDLAPLQAERAALTPLESTAKRIAGRLLIFGLSAELWPEFWNVAALARRFSDVTAVVPEPEFKGRKQLDEKWVEMWQAILGAEAEVVESDGFPNAGAIAELGTEARGSTVFSNLTNESRGLLRVGRTRRDEMRLVAGEIAKFLSEGARHIGVIFPGPTPAYALLCEILEASGIQFHTTIESAGGGGIEIQLQRMVIQFYRQGARLEDLLELWPLFKQVGFVTTSVGEARRICERLFDERQSHALGAYTKDLEDKDRPEWIEIARVVGLLLPVFPPRIGVVHFVERLNGVWEAFGLPSPQGMGTLQIFGSKESGLLPTDILLATALSLIPEGTSAIQPGESSFARVTLLTRRRAEGVSFSHLVLAESNAGVWPRRIESSPWLTDEHRAVLDKTARFSLGVFSSEERAWIERQSYAGLIRDTAETVLFSASLFDEADPERRLAPNRWIERWLWADVNLREQGSALDEVFAEMAVAYPRQHDNSIEVARWHEVWRGRRNPEQPFDEYFFSVDPRSIRPEVLSARLVERGVQDPAELWFDAVLGARAVAWRPLLRARRKSLGQWVHRVLAVALQPGERSGELGARRPLREVQDRLSAELARLAAGWPRNRYWDSFQLELARACEQLLAGAEGLQAGAWVGTELSLPVGATIPIGQSERLALRGRVDLAYFDRPEWGGAAVDIVDFKTGADSALSGARMARAGFGLQLGVYLAAAESLGVSSGRVWMVKPEAGEGSSLELSDLPDALLALQQLGTHLRSGIYGALTRDLSEFAPEGRAWPLACVHIAAETLEKKFAVTFQRGGDDE